MNATPTAAGSAAPVRSSSRAWARELAQAPTPIQRAISCSTCGLLVKSEQSLEAFAALLVNVGWKGCNGGMRCPECEAGVIRRVVIGSQGDPYILRYVGDAWQCSCLGYTHRKRCWHSAALNKETKEKERLVTLATDFLNDTAPGAMVFPADFLLWLGDDAPDATVEESRAVLAAVLEGYRRACPVCDGKGGEEHIIGGWEEPIYEGYRCTHCDGEGFLEPPQLAPLEDAMPIAAE